MFWRYRLTNLTIEILCSMPLRKYLGIACLLSVLLWACTPGQPGQQLMVVAAANIKPALDSVIQVFKLQHPQARIGIIYGASGKLTEQISNDAPFDLFFSADMNFPKKLKETGFTISDSKLYAIGRLALWSKKTDPGISQMNTLLDAGIHKISIADPRTAPYGEKAIECLKYYKLYDSIQNKLVFGENISQSAQFITSGAADIGIISLSLALSPEMQKEGGHYYIVPEISHKPIEQACVLLKHAQRNATAKELYEFISTSIAVNILTHYGYIQKMP